MPQAKLFHIFDKELSIDSVPCHPVVNGNSGDNGIVVNMDFLKGLSHKIDFNNFDKNLQNLA